MNILIFLCLFFAGIVTAQSQPLTDIVTSDSKFIISSKSQEVTDFFTFSNSAATYFYPVFLFSLSAIGDDYFRVESQNYRSPSNQFLGDIGNFYGSAIPTILFAGGYYASGIFNDNFKHREIGVTLINSILLSTMMTQSLKMMIGRSRPYVNQGHTNFHGFTFSDNDHFSFPSGHTSVSFALSTVMAHYAESEWEKWMWYGLALNGAFARIYFDKHWFSDTVVGGFLGYMAAKTALSESSTRQPRLTFHGHYINYSIPLN